MAGRASAGTRRTSERRSDGADQYLTNELGFDLPEGLDGEASLIELGLGGPADGALETEALRKNIPGFVTKLYR
jgi:hypothetical protein